MAPSTSRDFDLRVYAVEYRRLCLAEALGIRTAAITRPPLLHFIVLPAADRADLVATEGLAEYDEAAAGAGVAHVVRLAMSVAA